MEAPQRVAVAALGCQRVVPGRNTQVGAAEPELVVGDKEGREQDRSLSSDSKGQCPR